MASKAEEVLSGQIPFRTTTTRSQVQTLVARARVAQASFEEFSQAQVDTIVKAIGKYVYDNADLLARMAVDESGIGVYEDKILKNKGKARVIWNNLKSKKSRGIIKEIPESNMLLVAKAMGVVGAVTPVTNPIVTPMCNAMFALKAGNAIIFAPHPKAEGCARHLTEAFMREVKAHGGPEDLIQVVQNGSIETTRELMRDADVVVATGGAGMVRSAYSSGKPSYGVGAGSVPVIIDHAFDLGAAAQMIVAGAAFDNGIICSHEQFVLTPEKQYEATIQAFKATGKVWFTADPHEVQAYRDLIFPGGHMNKDVVGRSPADIASMAGLQVPHTARVILLPADGSGSHDLLALEKLCPVVAILPYSSFENAVDHAKANLLIEGAGHTAALHSHDEANIRYMGVELPISRLVVNQTSATSAGGSLTNGFAPTTTLGCGSWGGNSISENLDYKHLMNVARIGKVITGKKIPTDAEIWA